MNFFELQDQARKQTRWLVIAFILAVIAIVLAINLMVLLLVGMTPTETGEMQQFGMQLATDNVPLLSGTAIGTVSIILLASLFKTASLRAGGGKVARELGGTLVESDTRDTNRRRLRNVVEEIALASGVPVPEIYVLEQEAGINAFAAGYTPSDAAVAVTRGALEKLRRDELQGVIAHEFSHILNGDMRINIRLMGTLFGIMLIALIGRRILIHSHFVGRSSRDKGGMVVLLIALGLTAIGYVGLFFGRWIKAAVSRQREYLADASAVQFTRDPDGIAGALKKIAVYGDGSYLNADTEEISHMLFGNGQKMRLFSTHPPLNERIGRIDRNFRPEDLQRLAEKIRRERTADTKKEARKAERVERAGRGMFDAASIIDQIGSPDWERMLMAAAITASIPDHIGQAAHSVEWAPEVLFYTLLDRNSEVMEQQLLMIAQHMGSDSEAQVSALLDAGGLPLPEQRLPLLEMAFPALKRRPPDYIAKVLGAVNALIEADGRVDVFEYLLAGAIKQHMWESQNPQHVKLAGNKLLNSCKAEALQVMSILASHGHASEQEAEAAFRAGVLSLGIAVDTPMPRVENWVVALDQALPKLDGLKATEKEKLVRALTEIVLQDGQLLPSELELLRVTCDLIHVPLPLLTQSA